MRLDHQTGEGNGTFVPDPSHNREEKHSDLSGGLLNEEVLSSSKTILQRTPFGNGGGFKGAQQWFAPKPIAKLVSEVLYKDFPTIDTTAGTGQMLKFFAPQARYGIEFDTDYQVEPIGYAQIAGDAQKAVPMLRAAGIRFPQVAINPPYGLSWRDPAHRKGEINSQLLAFLWAIDLMESRGQGAILCRTTGLQREILALEEAKGVYAVINLTGQVWDSVQTPVSLVFFVHPHNVKSSWEPSDYRKTFELENTSEIVAYRQDILDARGDACYSVSRHRYDHENEQLARAFDAVSKEYAKRKRAEEKGRQKVRHDLSIRGKKLVSTPGSYAKLALAKLSALRTVEGLHHQHVNYFVHNKRAWDHALELETKGVITISNTLKDRLAEVLGEREKVLTPLFPLKDQMRLGWLADLDRISCKKSDPVKRFAAGEEYGLTTRSKTESTVEHRPHEKLNGEVELRQFTIERKLLEVTIRTEERTSTFDESPENIRYLIEHFEIPDPGDVATRYPELVESMRQLLTDIEEEKGFRLKNFQKDHMSRLLTKKRGLLAHEQGLGKTLMLMTLAEAATRLGAENKVLFVVPQDLIPQWQREAKKFFGIELEEIRTPAKAREVARRLEAGGTGWFITYYECLSIVGKTQAKDEKLPHVYLDHKESLAGRLAEYKKLKRQKKVHSVDWRVGAIRAPKVPEEAKPRGRYYDPVHAEVVEDAPATSRWACPKCKTDTAHGWTGEVCRREPHHGFHGCSYVHRRIKRKPAYAFLGKCFIDGVICVDELSEIRGDTSLRSKAIRGLARGQWKFGGTGTPLSNYINDAFWGLWWTLGNATPAFPYDYRAGKTKFEEDFAVIEYMHGSKSKGKEHVRERRKVLPRVTNVSQFWRLVQPSVSRCRKEQTGEPLVKRTYHPLRVPQGVAQKSAGDFWLYNFQSYFGWKYPNHPLVEAGLVWRFEKALGLNWRLEFAATMPSADEPTHEWPHATEQDFYEDLSPWTPATLKVLELAIEHAEKGEKVLIGSDLIVPGEFFARQLQLKGVNAVHLTEEKQGRISTKNPRKRASEVEEFTQGRASVMCAGINAMKLGHNLDVASTVIVHGLPYSHMVMDQFIARVHRLTSKKEVHVYVVVPKNTIAEKKWQLLKDKAGASDLAFDGELMVQDEEEKDLATIIQEMKDAGIQPRDDEISESDVHEMWKKVRYNPPRPVYGFGSTTSASQPKPKEEVVLIRAHDRRSQPGQHLEVVQTENGLRPDNVKPKTNGHKKAAKKKHKQTNGGAALFSFEDDGQIVYEQTSLF